MDCAEAGTSSKERNRNEKKKFIHPVNITLSYIKSMDKLNRTSPENRDKEWEEELIKVNRSFNILRHTESQLAYIETEANTNGDKKAAWLAAEEVLKKLQSPSSDNELSSELEDNPSTQAVDPEKVDSEIVFLRLSNLIDEELNDVQSRASTSLIEIVKQRDKAIDQLTLKLTETEKQLTDVTSRFEAIQVGENKDEEENKDLKLIISKLEESKTLNLKILEVTQELEKKGRMSNSIENRICTCNERQGKQTRKKDGLSGSVNPVPSDVLDSSVDDNVHVNQEPIDEFISDQLQTESQSMDDDIDIDIKEEEVGYEHSKSLDIPIKREIDESIQRMFHSSNQVASTKIPEDVRTGKILGNETSVNPQMPSQSLFGRKEPYLTTRTSEKIHKCVTCSTRFDTQFKLKEHNKIHTGENGSRTNLKVNSAKRSSTIGKTTLRSPKSKEQKFKSPESFTRANEEEQKRQGRSYDSNFCGFCSKLMGSVRTWNGHVSKLHLTCDQ